MPGTHKSLNQIQAQESATARYQRLHAEHLIICSRRHPRATDRLRAATQEPRSLADLVSMAHSLKLAAELPAFRKKAAISPFDESRIWGGKTRLHTLNGEKLNS
jgi:hypothetical protein